MKIEEWCWFTGLIMASTFLLNNDLIFMGILGIISMFISIIFMIFPIKQNRRKK